MPNKKQVSYCVMTERGTAHDGSAFHIFQLDTVSAACKRFTEVAL